MAYKTPISEPIAIVGAACRFAGGATTPSRLWQLLEKPMDLSQEIPASRFNVKAFYHPDGEYHGTTNSPKAYFIDQDHRVFDAAFFNISPKEAEAIDPQQRMLLEVVYEALESAGYSLHQYTGEKVAVFAGLMTGDFDSLSQRDELDTSQYYATGNARSILSNRISYFFNFAGPSMTIDTACSSSLVALHQAILSLRSGECKMACVAGANLILTPENFIAESNLHMLSPTGHCRMWDAAADGYARGEGVAAMFIKPLSQALADGDHIVAIIRETGVNSDGRSRGITMPNWEAQSRLIQDTYRRTGLDPEAPEDRCQYFEAHGTGTIVGDPNEARAIEDAFFGQHKSSASDVKLLVGSVKTVIGHTEGAAGLAGLLKVVESMHHGTVPPNLHLDKLNPDVEPYYSHLFVPTSAVAWPDVPVGQPRRGSVNSFGFGGTNAHAIVEQYVPAVHDPIALSYRPGLKTPTPSDRLRGAEHGQVCLPLLLSAPSQKSLVAVAKAYRDHLIQGPAHSIQELAWHTYARQTAFPFRLAVSGLSLSGLVNKLDTLIAESKDYPNADTLGTRARLRDEQPKILGVFTGQGAQWATMSRGLFLSSKVYADTIRSLDAILRTCPEPPSWTLENEIMADAPFSRISEASISQPLCTAVQLALTELLRSLGITFHTVLGHSSGEIAAAYAAGRISLGDAMLIAYYRGLGVDMARGADNARGGMVAVGLSRTEAEELCARPEYLDRLWVAASNAPASTTLSGDVDAVGQVREELTKQGKFARVLFVDTAYHSPRMEGPSAKYVEALKGCGITPLAGNNTIWVSSMLGQGQPSRAELAANYWKENMVRPVLFYEAVAAALDTHGPFDCAIEVGPHPALKSPVMQTVKTVMTVEKASSIIPYSSLLHRKLDDREAFADFLGWMWTHFGSSSPQIRQFVSGSLQPELVNSRVVNTPSYPWNHSQKFYRESRISRQYHFKVDRPHELLGVRTRDDNKHQLRWRNILSYHKLPWAKHHSFQGQALLPASAYLVMTLDAARIALAGRQASVVELRNLEFHSGIILEPDTFGVEILFNLSIEREFPNAIDASFTLTSVIAGGSSDMKKNFSGSLTIALGNPSSDALPARPASRAETLHANPDAFYDMMASTGLVYSSAFRGLQTLERRYNFASGTLKKYHDEDTTSLSISPATLDSCLQTAFVTVSSPGDNAIWGAFLPLEIGCVRFSLATCTIQDRDRDRLVVDAYLTNATPATEQTAASYTADIEIFNPKGDMEIQIQGLTVGCVGLTSAEDDYELYLTTRFDTDPDYEIVSSGPIDQAATNPNLVKSCERVAALYSSQTPTLHHRSLGLWLGQTKTPRPPKPWGAETEETLDSFIRTSPYFVTLDFIRELGKNLPDVLVGMLPAIMEEAHQLVAFQQHVSRVVTQISHKYPRMSVLGLLDTDMGLTEHVLTGLNDSFTSYRLGLEPERNLDARIPLNDPIRRKILVKGIDLNATEPEENSRYDLVLLTSSIIDPQKTASTLRLVGRMMRPGAFLMLVNVSRSPLKDRIRRYAGISTGSDVLPSPPDWPDLLDSCGFGYSMKNGNQYYPPGFSLIIRHSDSTEKISLLNPFANLGHSLLSDRLLVVGGKKKSTALISSSICSALAPRCGGLDQAETLEWVDVEYAASFSAVIILSDVDEPILATMTNKRMEALRALFKPQMTVLWVTHNARFLNPDHAASFGFTRTLAAEVPGLILQMLDLTTADTATASVAITETFARLVKHSLAHRPSGSGPLWINEPEIHLEDGHRLVPRVVPWKEGNNRVNAFRRVVKKTVNTLEKTVRIVESAPSGEHSTYYHIEAEQLGAWVLDMSTGSSQLSHLLMQTMPRNCRYTACKALLGTNRLTSDEKDAYSAKFWDKAVALSLAKAESRETAPAPALTTISDLLRAEEPSPPFCLVDWKSDRLASQTVKPLAGTGLLSPTKTRNPPKTQPNWQTETMAKGINVRFETLDVTSLEQVLELKAKLSETLPPVGGVVNGAMVLEDGVFSQMSLDTFHRVMKPKTIGSRNLDQAFSAADMDFFIMTSSFAAIGGHAGQSNYAAANMYMNGLAASRRRRGLPGSVLNIGVIYGLGFLHREKGCLYQGLEREGYPPISERDIHHMFVEAIVAGKPTGPGRQRAEEEVYDITTGLRRFPASSPTLHWHHDPRFGHLNTRRDDHDDDDDVFSGAPRTVANASTAAGASAAWAAGSHHKNDEGSLRQRLDAATTHDELVDVLEPAFADEAPGSGSVTAEHSIVDLGVDSLAALSMRAWAWKALGQDVAAMKLLSGATVAELCREIAGGILEGRKAARERSEQIGEADDGAAAAAAAAAAVEENGSEVVVATPGSLTTITTASFVSGSVRETTESTAVSVSSNTEENSQVEGRCGRRCCGEVIY
ncbi:polyketide synthase [Thermothelomyces thermophilus ATCC 42464]|uniref:Polyketide synthase n=1 Tax=Thermothelomyces thermophilus (strain ATCC 42464 / BCRC 31852 / DSM 1799) TaxID=573729 RepID=G2QJ44_THET4|nr:polyketide synthase [Thermothelomyces thermophilus ATCC 42464]AEO59619.1 polyketide synthase [Thermothelomyces thermophilus ATCC 42464]